MNGLQKILPAFGAFAMIATANVLPANAQEASNIALIIDASGSMNAKLNDGSTRISSAKSAVEEFTRSLPADSNISLRSYGDQSDRSEKNCKDTQLLVPFGTMSDMSSQIIGAASGLNARGYTPISHVLGLAAADLKPLEGTKTVVLVSDGKETCAGDPCLVAKQLAEADSNLVIHTVGLGVDAATKSQLQCIARVARGQYFDAANASDLSKSMLKAAASKPQKKKIIKVKSNVGTLELIGKSWNNIEVLDAETEQKIGSLHQVAQKLTTRSGVYNLKFKDKLIQKSVEVVAGETTKVTPAQVKLQMPDTTLLYILDPETGEVLGDINAYSNNPDTIPAGRYDFALGSKKLMKYETEVVAGELTEIPSGMLQLVGKHWEAIIKDPETNETVNSISFGTSKGVLFPGKYNYGAGVGYKLNIPFEIKPGETTMFNPGGVKITPNGDYEIYSASGEHIADQNSLVGSARLPNGSYLIKIGGSEVPFEIADNEMVEIQVE